MPPVLTGRIVQHSVRNQPTDSQDILLIPTTRNYNMAFTRPRVVQTTLMLFNLWPWNHAW